MCLGFTIFERDLDTNTFRLFERTFYSENITHGKGLDVIRLCNLSGPIGGGKSITVLATLRQKCNYSIYMYHVNDQGEIDWNYTIESQNLTKRGNAITFDLPQGPLGIDDERILVYLDVIEIRTDNTILSGSKTMKFFYKNYGMEKVAANSNITQSSLACDYNTNGFVCYNCGTYNNHSGLSQLSHPMANACGWRTIAATNPGNTNNSLCTSGEHSHIVPSSSSNQFPGGEYQANTSNVMLIDVEITPSDNPDTFND